MNNRLLHNKKSRITGFFCAAAIAGVSTLTAVPASAASPGFTEKNASESDSVYVYFKEDGGIGVGKKNFELWANVSRSGNSYEWSGHWSVAGCTSTLGGPGQIGIDVKSSSGSESRHWQECTDSHKTVSGRGPIEPGDRVSFRLCHWGGVIPFTTCGNWFRSAPL